MNLRNLIIKSGILGFLLICISVFVFIIGGYYAASKPVKYLPKIDDNDIKCSKLGENCLKLERPWYNLYVDQKGYVKIKNNKGEDILSDLLYFADYVDSGSYWGLKDISIHLSNDSTILIIGNGPLDVQVQIKLTAHSLFPKIDFNIRTIYKRETIVRREALVAVFDAKVSEIYLKNSKVNVGDFEPEYWLHREGVRFGTGNKSALIYNTPKVSSLQLDTERNLLFFNLDYYLDHPYIHIPFQKNGGGRWNDRSTAMYVDGDERDNNFSIYFGTLPKAIPRIMKVPNGYLAGYVFTEHADQGNLRTHRAAYFGSDDIEKAENAVGGFVKHKIPTTKSVFYSDFSSQQDSLKHEEVNRFKLLTILNQLNGRGYDICLHTPENDNSNRKVLEESIKFMKENFNTITWIDHGMYHGNNNRECIVCDGLDSISDNYAADLWKKYNTRYFWSPAVELIRDYSLKENILKLRFKDASMNLWRRFFSPRDLDEMSLYDALMELKKRFSSKLEFNSLCPNKGNAFPTPLYWQHFTRTKNFYSWATEGGYGTDDLSSPRVVKERESLNKLITDWGVFINHGYYVANPSNTDKILINLNGKIVINPYFEEILGTMADMRDRGDLYITTISELLNYWILTENISFEYLPHGSIKVINNNSEPVNGFSLVVRSDSVRIDGEIPKFRRIGEDIIFWFDIPAKHSIKIEVDI